MKLGNINIAKAFFGTAEIKKVMLGTSLVYQSEPNYVRFVSAEARTITPKYTNSGVTLQYSVDSGATWTTITSGSQTTSATEHWFRGQATGTKSLFTSIHWNNTWEFSGSSIDLEVYGNLNFLLCDTLGGGVAPTSLGTYAYTQMFQNLNFLTTAPELPATTLGDYCYRNMFNGCTSLTTPPELPATTLGDYCYQNMFSYCISLIKAPELPATTLASNCYGYMFHSCTSLTTPPKLPATTLGNSCYSRMFQGCTSLTTAPELPATTLANACYYGMFVECTSLTTPPELPATTLAINCYVNMFNGCTSFKVSATNTGSYTYAWRIPTSGTGTTASSWNQYMIYGTGGTFTSDPTINTTYYVENQPVGQTQQEPEMVTATFNSNGGSPTYANQSGYDSLNVTNPGTPTRDGYTFNGWSPSLPRTITSNTTFTAQWQDTSVTVTATFDSNGGSPTYTSWFGYDSLYVTSPGTPTRDGYTFNGWSPSLPRTITSNTNFVAQWLQDSELVVATFDSDGGTPTYSSQSGYDSLYVTNPGTPTRAGYTFDGWNPSLPRTITSNTTFTAQWGTPYVHITATFDSNGGTPTYDSQLGYNSLSVTNPGTPTRAGYTFTGWLPALPRTITSNTNFVAQWLQDSELVVATFDSNGGTPTYDSQLGYNSLSVTNPGTPTRSGSTFIGWSPSLPRTITSDTTFVAQWTDVVYTITWKAYNGATLKTDYLTYGETSTAPPGTDDTNQYDYSWPKSSTTVTGNETIQETRTTKSYTITFHSNGGTPDYENISVPFGGMVYSPGTPTRSGYTFTGWSPALPRTITTSTTFTAQWQLEMAKSWQETSNTNYTTTFEFTSGLHGDINNYDPNYQGCATPSLLLSQLNASRPATSEVVGTIIRVRNNLDLSSVGGGSESCSTYMYYEAVDADPVPVPREWMFLNGTTNAGGLLTIEVQGLMDSDYLSQGCASPYTLVISLDSQYPASGLAIGTQAAVRMNASFGGATCDTWALFEVREV